MVFDVESVGLHGEAFAVGWVVINLAGDLISEGFSACNPSYVPGTSEGRDWVEENCHFEFTTDDPTLVKEAFWSAWLNWKKEGTMLAADCAWPVEARFLIRCVDLRNEERQWEGPYPLIDISSVLLAKGMDPLETYPRLSAELPAHNPLCDARQSARILIEALSKQQIQP